VLGLLPERATTSGLVRVDGADVLAMPPAKLRELRLRRAAMVFQDPRASINPLRRIGDFLTEGLRAGGVPPAQARDRAVELLESVGIDQPAAALRRYPHEYSGGMLQRVMIAAAVAGEPGLLLADEPTTALDVTTQAEVISILTGLQARLGMGMLFVTHNLELAAAVCDRIYVMYAGRVVEAQTADGLFDSPMHPYTRGLIAATPSVESDRLPRGVAGRPLSLAEAPVGCSFAARCPHAAAVCGQTEPELRPVGGVPVACHRAEELNQ
jgi:peptide/nickel transport system ATP-binding protein